jgi:hypothetical protein
VPIVPLATPQDLEDATGQTFTTRQAAMAIRRASARVRTYCRQEITVVENDTVLIPGDGRVLTLPKFPVIVDDTHPLTVIELFGVANVEYEALENRDFTRIGAQLTRGEPWWTPNRLMGYPRIRAQGAWAPRVRVTYTHGWTEVPDDILDIVLDLATMNITNPLGLRTESTSIDDFTRSKTYAAEMIGGAQLSDAHKDALRPYRASGVFSVAPVT